MPMPLPLTKDVVREDLELTRKIIVKWLAELEEGFPGVDKPSPPQNVEEFLTAFCGELRFVSDKCASMANLLSGMV